MTNQNSTSPVTIVTGGTFGLGLDISIELAKRGHQVVAIGLKESQVSSTAKGFDAIESAIESNGLKDKVDVIEADVSSEKDVAKVVDFTIKKYQRIDNLVNNAAIGPLGTILDTAPDIFEKIYRVNVMGVYLTSKMIVPIMTKQGGGSIVNVGSGAGYGKPNMAAYATSKGAVLALSTAMAYDHFKDHIRVNVVIPGGGGIISGMSLGRFGGDVNAFNDPKRKIVGSVAGRPINGVDFANSIAFLLSAESSTITGTVIDVGCFANQGGPAPLTN